MVPTGPWQYNFTLYREKPLYNCRIAPNLHWFQSVCYLEVSLYCSSLSPLTSLVAGLRQAKKTPISDNRLQRSSTVLRAQSPVPSHNKSVRAMLLLC